MSSTSRGSPATGTSDPSQGGTPRLTGFAVRPVVDGHLGRRPLAQHLAGQQLVDDEVALENQLLADVGAERLEQQDRLRRPLGSTSQAPQKPQGKRSLAPRRDGGRPSPSRAPTPVAQHRRGRRPAGRRQQDRGLPPLAGPVPPGVGHPARADDRPHLRRHRLHLVRRARGAQHDHRRVLRPRSRNAGPAPRGAL